MAESQFSQPPPSSDGLPLSVESRRPLTSTTSPRGGLAGDMASASPLTEDSFDLPTPGFWPFTPIPDPTPIEIDDSIYLSELPPWPFTLISSALKTVVEETFGIWELEAGRIVKKGKLEVGAVPTMRDLDLVEEIEGEHADLVKIATLQGWEGLWNLTTLQMLKMLLPIFFEIPTVRSSLEILLCVLDICVDLYSIYAVDLCSIYAVVSARFCGSDSTLLYCAHFLGIVAVILPTLIG